MDKMSVVSIVFVSLPEAILVFIIILTVAGYIEALNFRDRKHIIKIFFASVFSVIFSVALRSFLPLATLSFVIMFLLYPIIMLIIFRSKLLSTILGTVLAFSIFIIGELICTIFMNIMNFSLSQVYSNDAMRIFISLPTRIIQIIAVIIICRIKNISFKMDRLNAEQWIQLILFIFMIVSSMVSIESGLNNINRDTKTIVYLMVNILIALVFSSWTVYNIFRLRKKNLIDEKIRNIELERIRKLLAEGCSEHVIELIDLTLMKRSVKS